MAKRVRLLVLDVDGVLTDGGMYYGADGTELKRFDTRDAQGVALCREAGIETVLVTREDTPIVTRRAAKMGVEACLGITDKLSCVRELAARRGVALSDICYVGDDVHDVAVMRGVGFPVAVADATGAARAAAAIVTERSGGRGAVREVCELLLEAQGRTDHG